MGALPTVSIVRPNACPECGAPRHRLYLAWRRRGDSIEETWGCSGCYRLGEWRLATWPTLAAVSPADVSSTDRRSRDQREGDRKRAERAAVVVAAATARAEIRALFDDVSDEEQEYVETIVTPYL